MGRDAREHPQYRLAVRQAEREKWDPGWIRGWPDVGAVVEHGAYFEESAGDRVCNFFSKGLKLLKGPMAGQPFVPADYQAYDLLRPLYGWKRPGGARRFRKGALWIPKKNAKSAVCSGLGLYDLKCPLEPMPEVYSAAGSRKQASIIHDEAAKMAKRSPLIMDKLKVIPSTKVILNHRNDGRFVALSADADLEEGLNWTLLLFDELHVQRNRAFYGALAGGGIGRREPLMLAISTAGSAQSGIGWDEWDYCLRVMDGTLEDWEYFARAYYSHEREDWEDPLQWAVANPGLGVTIQPEMFEQLFREARNKPSEQNRILRYHLNRWTQRAEHWIDIGIWDRCTWPVDLERLVGRECYAGYDGSSRIDLTSLGLVFPPETDDEPLTIWTKSWVPEHNMEGRVKTDNVPYDIWAREGWIEATPGQRIDTSKIRYDINEIAKWFKIQEIACDPAWFGELENWLQEDGFTVLAFPQSMRNYTMPMAELEARLKDGSLAHGQNPLLRWAVGNLMVRKKWSGEMMPDKKAATERIDPIVAVLMGIARWLTNAGAEGMSMYEKRDVLIV